MPLIRLTMAQIRNSIICDKFAQMGSNPQELAELFSDATFRCLLQTELQKYPALGPDRAMQISLWTVVQSDPPSSGCPDSFHRGVWKKSRARGRHEEWKSSGRCAVGISRPITIFESSQSLRSVKSSIMMCHTRPCNSFTIIMTRSSIANAVTRMRTKSSCAGRSTATTNADACVIRSFPNIVCIIIQDQLLYILFLKSTKNCGKLVRSANGTRWYRSEL